MSGLNVEFQVSRFVYLGCIVNRGKIERLVNCMGMDAVRARYSPFGNACPRVI